MNIEAGSYDQVMSQWNCQDNPINSDNLEESHPCIGSTGLVNWGKLYNSGNDGNAEIDPVASMFVEIPPVDEEP